MTVGSKVSRARLTVLAAAVLGLVGVAAYALFFSSWLVLETVEVKGTSTLTAIEVRAMARVGTGTPLARVDTDGVRDRVAALRPVKTVEVRRSWPDTLVISVDEREPALVLDGPEGLAVYDLAGVEFLHPDEAPEGVPILQVGAAEPAAGVLDAVLAVVGQLPANIHGRVAEVLAPTPDSLALRLTGGVLVEWGSSADSARKAQVLAQLMKHPASTYNVTAPDVPAIRPLPTPTP